MTIGRVSLPIGKTTSELFPHAVHEVRRLTCMKANEFDKKFDDNGAEIISALDLSKAKRPMLDQKRVNVDFPIWMIESMDREANRLGVTRQSIIKIWLAERLEQIYR
jgi:hypothetical protein